MLKPGLTDPEESIRRATVEAFAKGRQWDVVLPLLKDPDPQIRQRIISALAAYPAPTPVIMDQLAHILHTAITHEIYQSARATLQALVERAKNS